MLWQEEWWSSYSRPPVSFQRRRFAMRMAPRRVLAVPPPPRVAERLLSCCGLGRIRFTQVVAADLFCQFCSHVRPPLFRVESEVNSVRSTGLGLLLLVSSHQPQTSHPFPRISPSSRSSSRAGHTDSRLIGQIKIFSCSDF
jgi:hypothetical protein